MEQQRPRRAVHNRKLGILAAQARKQRNQKGGSALVKVKSGILELISKPNIYRMSSFYPGLGELAIKKVDPILMISTKRGLIIWPCPGRSREPQPGSPATWPTKKEWKHLLKTERLSFMFSLPYSKVRRTGPTSTCRCVLDLIQTT